MTTSPATTIDVTSDPVQSATAALASAGANFGNAASGMAAQVRGFFPAAGRLLSRTVYNGCYYTSYGITFPTVFLVHMIPGGVPLAAGISDGARSAQDYVRRMRKPADEKQQLLETSVDDALASTIVSIPETQIDTARFESTTVGAKAARVKAAPRKRAAKPAPKSAKRARKTKPPGH